MNYDRQITISVGNNRRDMVWKQTVLTVEELYKRLSTPVRGTETLQDYLHLKKSQQDDLKDVGGFVGGSLLGQRRKANNVTGRDIITLDFDNIPGWQTETIIGKMDELGFSYCIMLKWNGETWDFILPGNFGITAKDDNGEIVGAIFAAHTAQGSRHFTRLEYHRFEGSTAEGGKLYKITNKAFENRLSTKGEVTLGEEVALDKVDAWAHLAPEVTITNLETPLFGYYRVPGANTVDPSSPLGLSVFANAIAELKAIDIAVSRKNTEIEDSKHITFVGQQLIQNAQNRNVELPRFVKGLGMGLSDGEVSAIHEHAPTLLTDARIKDINFDLSMAGVKCGFSEGVFVLDGQTGMITATQVEADDRDTIQTIKTDRDALKDAITQALAGADALVTLYNLAPLGEYEVNFNFGDVTYNYEEDKASWRAYVMQGWVPKWMYFVKFEGMSEEEAKAMTAEADAAQIEKAQLFGAE